MAVAYPIVASANQRYLVDQNGVPFLIMGEGSAQLLCQKIPSVFNQWLTDRAGKGFNAIWMHFITDQGIGGNTGGLTDDGIAPFTGTINGSTIDGGPAYDLSTPNPTYFARIDSIIQAAALLGITVFCDTLDCDSYLQLFEANSTAQVTAYASYLANRYKSFPNIVWMTGNDFQTWQNVPSDNQIASNIMSTIAGVDTAHLQTTELDYFISGSLDDALLVPYTTLAGAYTYYPVYGKVLAEYNSSAKTAPVYLIESFYEGINTFGITPSNLVMRKLAYWTVLAGGLGGYFYGSQWYTFPTGWASDIDTVAVTHLGLWKAFFTSLPWYNLVPDQMNVIVTAGFGTPTGVDQGDGYGTGNVTSDNYITTAASADGTLLVSYLQVATTLTVNMTKLKGAVTARWFDPTNATYATIAGSPFADTGTQNFTSPGNNSTGDPDWILMLQGSGGVNTAAVGLGGPPASMNYGLKPHTFARCKGQHREIRTHVQHSLAAP